MGGHIPSSTAIHTADNEDYNDTSDADVSTIRQGTVYQPPSRATIRRRRGAVPVAATTPVVVATSSDNVALSQVHDRCRRVFNTGVMPEVVHLGGW